MIEMVARDEGVLWRRCVCGGSVCEKVRCGKHVFKVRLIFVYELSD